MNLEYAHLDMKNLPNYRDWRLPENRIEAFSRITHVRMVEGDLDHHHVGKVICDVMQLNKEEKAWYALVFGQSYRNHVAMITTQLFRDFSDTSDATLTQWHDKNWKRLKYAKDTKWNLSKLPQFVQDVKSKIGSGGLYEYLGNAASVGNKEQNYKSLNEALKGFYSIGRMTAWLAQQTLYEFFDWDIDNWDQQLYDNATWSQYDSICYLFDRLDIARQQKITNQFGEVLEIKKYNPTKSDIKLMEANTQVLMEEVNKHCPFHVDIYNIESVECEFRKTAYGPRIKEFTFWTTNELVEQYEDLKNLWNDGTVDWRPYAAGFMTKGPNVSDFGYDKEYFRVMVDWGMNLNTHTLYKDEPNAHEVLVLPKSRMPSVELLKRDWEDGFSETERIELKKIHNPVAYLKFKPKTHESWSNSNIDFSYAKSFV